MALLALTPVAQLRVDVEGRWVEAAPAVAELLGYAPDELVGRFARDLVPPGDRADVVASLRSALRVSSERRAAHVGADRGRGAYSGATP